MTIAMIRRLVIPAVFLAGVALSTGAVVAAEGTQTFKADLSGMNQVPAVDSKGTGSATLRYNPATHELTWTITYSDLSSDVTAAHIHSGAAGANGKVVIPLTAKGATANPSPIKGSATITDDQAMDLSSGNMYVNVHTTDHKGGEIRGQIMPASM